MPPLGIVGAGLALVASYLVVVALMYVFTQRLFPVPYEWGRLARVVARLRRPRRPRRAAAADRGLRRPRSPGSPSGSPTRSSSSLSGFFTAEERGWLARLRHPGELLDQLRAAPRRAAAVDGAVPEAYEAEHMDEDSRL